MRCSASNAERRSKQRGMSVETKQSVILVIEDDDDIRELVAFSLEEEGYRVEQAADGIRGQEMAEDLRPDLIVLDLMLPGKDGLSLCRELNKRAGESLPSPILMLTARGEEMDRIIKRKASPLYISVHATDPELRCRMLHNRFAGDIMDKVRRLKEAGIVMNGQIVLCKGVNDGEELERSIQDLTELLPELQSVSVVPVGLTRYRDGLYPLAPFTKEDAVQVLETIHRWQDKIMDSHGSHFIHAGDEWYILAEQPIPEEDTYDGYLQLENGVGMVRLLEEEVKAVLEIQNGDDRERAVTIATGELAAPFLEKYAAMIQEKYPNVNVQVIPVRNDFFGEKITVAGLLTGHDLMAQLKNRSLGDRLLITEHMLRSGERVFLDDVTVEDVENTLQIKISIVESSGNDFVQCIIE